MSVEKNRNEVSAVWDDPKYEGADYKYNKDYRKARNEYRETIAIEAFKLRDWLDASECGGIKAPPHVCGHECKHYDDFSLVKIDYSYDEVIAPGYGVNGKGYHTGYNRKDVYSDVYKVSGGEHGHNDLKVECLAGHESHGSIGAPDVFHEIAKHDGENVVCAIGFGEKDNDRVKEFYDKYNKDLDCLSYVGVPENADDIELPAYVNEDDIDDEEDGDENQYE